MRTFSGSPGPNGMLLAVKKECCPVVMDATRAHQIEVLPVPPSPAMVVIPYQGIYPEISHSGSFISTSAALLKLKSTFSLAALYLPLSKTAAAFFV